METRDFHHVSCGRPVDTQTRTFIADKRDEREDILPGLRYSLTVLFCQECRRIVTPRDLKEFQ